MIPAVNFEALRLANLQQKQKLLEQLNLNSRSINRTGNAEADDGQPRPKIRRLGRSSRIQPPPSRTSARIAASSTRVSYDKETHSGTVTTMTRVKKQKNAPSRRIPPNREQVSVPRAVSLDLPQDLPSLIQHYNSWTPAAPLPTLDPETNAYHFSSHPSFTPNKSPLSILLEGSFGGAYFSPWHSRSLLLTLKDDYLSTLPPDWLSQLQPPEKYVTSPQYNPELNKHGVQGGQTLSQWEDAGWINFWHDARGWFEWYIRFWLGRRLDDGEDERQVGRWARCVGPKGRWKRMLLKKYVETGARSCFDDEEGGNDDGEEEKISPVIHQTCLHWAYQVTQEDLDEAWRSRG